MEIRTVDVPDVAEWPGCIRQVFGAPVGTEDSVEACEALVDLTPGEQQVHVAWQPGEDDLARLANGGTVWLTVLGGLPPHFLSVRGGDA